MQPNQEKRKPLEWVGSSLKDWKSFPDEKLREESRRKVNMTEKFDVTPSCGNVFADLGLPNPDELLAKSELARKITNIIIERNMTQAEAAQLLGIDQPKVSALMRGRLKGFSLDRLCKYLNAFDNDIEIAVKRKSGEIAKTIVVC